MSSNSIGMIGSGSWATAMIKMLSDNEVAKSVFWWVRRDKDVEYIRKYKHNPNYLRSVEINFPEEKISSNIKSIFETSRILILNTPSAYLKDALKGLEKEDFRDKIIISAIKGIVPQENLVVGDYLNQVFDVPMENIVVIGGPCHAEEVSAERLSYLTVASQTNEYAMLIASLLRTRYINTVISDDIVGVEYAAVLKNIYALVGGICHGVGLGDNFQSVLVSNAVREMDYFLRKIDPQVRDINQSAYLGDLLVTAYSQYSRNRTFGAMIGKGYSVKSAQLEMNMVAEGFFASACIEEIIQKYKLEMPICDTVYRILYNNADVESEIDLLSQKLT